MCMQFRYSVRSCNGHATFVHKVTTKAHVAREVLTSVWTSISRLVHIHSHSLRCNLLVVDDRQWLLCHSHIQSFTRSNHSPRYTSLWLETILDAARLLYRYKMLRLFLGRGILENINVWLSVPFGFFLFSSYIYYMVFRNML